MKVEDLKTMIVAYRVDVGRLQSDCVDAADDKLVGLLQWAIDVGRAEGRREAFEEAAIHLESRGPEGFAHAQHVRRLS